MVYYLCRHRSTRHAPWSAISFCGMNLTSFPTKSFQETKSIKIERGALQVNPSLQRRRVGLPIASARVCLDSVQSNVDSQSSLDFGQNPPCTRLVTSAAILGSNSTAMTFFAFSSILTVKLPVPGPTSRTI